MFDSDADVWYADVSADQTPMADAPPPPDIVYDAPAPTDYAPATEPAPAYYDPPRDDSGAAYYVDYPSTPITLNTASAAAPAPVRSTSMATVSESDALRALEQARAAYGLTTTDAPSDLASIQHLEGHEGSGAVDSATIKRYIDAKYPAWAAPTASQGGKGGSADVNYDGLIDEGWYVVGASNDNLYFSQSATGYADRLEATGDELRSGPLSLAVGGVRASDLIRATLGPAAAARASSTAYRSALPGTPGSSGGSSGPAASPLDAALMSGTQRNPQTSSPAIGSPADATYAATPAGAGGGLPMLAAAAGLAYWLLTK